MFRSSAFTLLANHLGAPIDAKPSAARKEPPMLYEYTPHTCLAIMNRPEVLNSVNLEMIQYVRREVKKWNQMPHIKVVIFKGKGKAFCAGGDLKYLYDAHQKPNRMELLEQYLREVYSSFWELATMKPIQISFWDGPVMGGGVGYSIHSLIRIATEKCVFAMPEAKLGGFTDCTSGFFFSRLRNNLGYYFALTGAKLKGAEVVQVGLADHFVKSENLKQLEEEIIKTTTPKTTVEDLRAIVKKYEVPVERKFKNEGFINKMFGKGSIEEIYKALKETSENRELAQDIIKQLDQQCTISLKIVHEVIKRGKDLDLKDNLNSDLRIMMKVMVMEGKDFFEGIRCTMIARNEKPAWVYKCVDEVPRKEVESYFVKKNGFVDLIEG